MSFSAIIPSPSDHPHSCVCPWPTELPSLLGTAKTHYTNLNTTITTLTTNLPTTFDLLLLLATFNLIAWNILRTRPNPEDHSTALLSLRTQQAVKSTFLLLILHSVKALLPHCHWATGSTFLPVRHYTAAVCGLSILGINAVASLWPTEMELDPNAFPLGRPFEFYEFGVEDATVLPPYVVMKFRARGMKTEEWRLVVGDGVMDTM